MLRSTGSPSEGDLLNPYEDAMARMYGTVRAAEYVSGRWIVTEKKGIGRSS